MHNNQNLGSHFNNIIHMIGGLPQGHEKPLKHALYNAVALFLLFVCCAVGYALFLILDPFFKPLLWALLVGSLLHPIKYSLSTRLKQWFDNLESLNRPLFLGILVIPLNIVNDTFKLIGGAIHRYYKVALGVLICLLGLVLLYNWFPWGCFYFTWRFAKIFNMIILTLLRICNTYTFLTLVSCYMIAVYIMWNEERELLFRKTSLLVWLFGSGYISHLTGAFQAITFILLQIFAFVGFLLESYEIFNKMKNDGTHMSIYESMKWTILNTQYSTEYKNSLQCVDKDKNDPTNIGQIAENKNGTHEPIGIQEVKSEEEDSFPVRSRAAFQTRTLSSLPISTPETRSAIESHIVAALQRKSFNNENRTGLKGIDNLSTNNDELESTVLFKFLLWACAAMVLWKHTWLWPLVLIIIAILIIKSIGMFFGVWTFLKNIICDTANKVNEWFQLRYSAIVPAHVQGIIKLLEKLNKSLCEAAKGSIDFVSTFVVITGLILFLTCAPIFMGVQIYSEGITVVQMTGSLINRTVVHNPELRQLLPPGWDDTVDSLLDNAYLYGREGLSKAIKGVLKDSDSEKSANLEKQLLELWDRMYQTWMSDSKTTGPHVNSAAISLTWNSFVDDITKTPDIFKTLGIIDFAKQNVGTLMALLDSLWSLLKGNITLVLGSVSAITSVLLGGGTAVLNFILGLVVFFTTLFYLLNSSSSLYKPIEMISTFSPINGSRFGLALTDAVNGVFKATLKMAMFYGLWTWLIHNLFGAQVVFLPSALAAVLAAVPFLGTYLACIPAVLDLWLAQGCPVLAILLAICQFAPASYVDTIIYNEIKNGGHPYFTGLAIAGGIFCFGAEGAIFGPLLLCCLLVALNLSSSLFKETPMDEQAGGPTLPRLGLDRSF